METTVETKSAKTATEAIDRALPVSQSGPGARPPTRPFAWSLVLVPALVVLAGTGLVFNVAKARNRFFALFRSTKNASVAVASAPKPPRSIVVLPLQNLSNSSAEDYFADGMTDELTTDLAQFGTLRVISPNLCHALQGHGQNGPGDWP